MEVLMMIKWMNVQGGSNMTGTDYNKNIHKSIPVIFEPPCSSVECIFFDDGTQVVPTEHMQLETWTLKIEMNHETDTCS